jgi:hypothetical protein
MYTRIKAVIEKPGGPKAVEVFGYATKGIPGLQVIGMGSSANAIKEKFLYLSKVHELKIPARKYIICIEEKDRGEFKNNERQWLELPCLILFWSLANQLPIKKLEDCFCGGKVSSCGQVESLNFKEKDLIDLHKSFPRIDKKIKFIGAGKINLPEEIGHLPLEGLFGNMKKLYYKRPSH